MFLILYTVLSFHANFCDGYKQGYADAYCGGTNECLSTLVIPVCEEPKPHPGKYADGYDCGFYEGEQEKLQLKPLK